MELDLRNKKLDFTIAAPPSKSIYHRELIVRFLCGDYSHIEILEDDSEDVRATKNILRCLHSVEGNKENAITTDSDNRRVLILQCKESGSTLRFMIPVVSAFIFGKGRKKYAVDSIVIETEGRLFDRPIKELEEAMKPHGINIEKKTETRTIEVNGEMSPGEYVIDGSVSSQYISGLLMALTIFDEPCTVKVVGEMKSVHYIELTQDVLKKYGCSVQFSGSTYTPMAGGYKNKKGQIPEFSVEGDWSNGAFLLCLKEWSDIKVENLSLESRQGDRAIVEYLELVDRVKKNPNRQHPSYVWECQDIPDIVPYMATVAPFVFEEITFSGVSRLRIKESDRVKAVREQLDAVGIKTSETEDTLTVYRYETKNHPENVIKLSSYNDHRMAMCAILLAVILKVPVELDDIQCVKKSFPELLSYVNKYF